jgi:hypothetical protein
MNEGTDLRPTRLSVVVHMHDPGFLADEEIRRLSSSPLEALAGILQRHLSFRFGLYLPGRVLESAARSVPRVLDILRQAGSTGRVEWLGGGFHDPLFAQVPESSRRSQIQMLSGALRQHVGAEPHGMWLPGFVWDPTLVTGFLQAGFSYSVLKDHQIPLAEDDARLGWFLTEELGVPFRLLPSREALCALFRAGAVEEMLRLASTPAVEGDDPPGGMLDVSLLASSREGFEPVHLERLSALAELCDAHPGQYELVLPHEAIRQGEPRAVVYPPPSAARAFCDPGPGGGVRDLLRRQPWANLCHKRMLHLLARSEQLPGPKIRALVADPLLQAQNASLFRDADEAGGIRYLRDRVRLGSLILEAETALDQTLPDDSVQVDALDLLCEGSQQVLVRNSKICLLLEPRRGGRLSALDFKSRKHPWGCSAKAPVLLETFLAVQGSPDAEEIAVGDFPDRPFEVQYKRTNQDLQVVMSRAGHLQLAGLAHPLLFEKTLTVRAGKAQVAATYKITNTGTHLLLFRFRCALSASPGEGVGEGQKHRIDPGQPADLKQNLASETGKSWEVTDKPAGVTLSWDLAKPAKLEAAPLLVRRGGDEDPGRLDGMVATAEWEIQLPPGESWSLISRLELGTTRRAS